jgi:tetratricopeptide (TPR) repeat protein
LKLGELSRAESLAVKALELSRRILGQEHLETLECLNAVGRVYKAQGRLSEAERIFSERAEACRRGLGEEDPRTWDSMVDLTILYLEDKKPQDAERFFRMFQEATTAGPPNTLAWLLATSPRKEIRAPKRAVDLARKAVDLAPASASIWNTLGVALYRVGDLKGAIEALEKSEMLAPDKHLANKGFFLAMAHWQLGEPGKARVWYERAVQWMEKNNPGDDQPRRFRDEAAPLLGVPGLAVPAEKEVPRPSKR